MTHHSQMGLFPGGLHIARGMSHASSQERDLKMMSPLQSQNQKMQQHYSQKWPLCDITENPMTLLLAMCIHDIIGYSKYSKCHCIQDLHPSLF